MQDYTKPYLSLDQQIEKLKSRGMQFEDEAKAKLYLNQIGYYRLSGFWYPFRCSKIGLDKNDRPINIILDEFRDETTFESAIALYIFDKKLRLLFLDALERIEIALRTCIALTIGTRGPWAYRNTNHLDANFHTRVIGQTNDTKFSRFIETCDRSFDKSKEEFVTHFRNTYNQPLPIWAAVELWDFGTLSVFAEGMKFTDKRILAREFNISRPEIFPSWIRTLAFVRNVCAHHSRLWNKPLIAQPKSPRENNGHLLKHLDNNNYALERPYAAAAIVQYLLLQINPTSKWNERLKATVNKFPDAPGIKIEHAGFPTDWKNLDLWQ